MPVAAVHDIEAIPPTRLGELIRDVRDRRGLKQAECAAHVGVSRETWSNWERGVHDVPASALPGIGRALRVRFTTDGAGRYHILELDPDTGIEPDRGGPQAVVFLGDAAAAIYKLMEHLGIPGTTADPPE